MIVRVYDKTTMTKLSEFLAETFSGFPVKDGNYIVIREEISCLDGSYEVGPIITTYTFNSNHALDL